jgi:hypothetical protein
MALLHNDRAVLTKTKYAEYAVKNSLVTGGIVIPGKSARIKTVPRVWTSVHRKSKSGVSYLSQLIGSICSLLSGYGSAKRILCWLSEMGMM